MSPTRWLRRPTSQAHFPVRRTRLGIEPLEDRAVPTAGFLDPTFAGDGVATTQVGAATYPSAHDVAVYPATGTADGKVVIAGKTKSSARGSTDFGLVRYNPDGSLDATFGKGGVVVTSVVGGDDYANAVAVLPDGKVLAAGWAADDVALVRYNPNGTLDTTFGSRGKVVTDVSGRSTDWGAAMRLQADGKIVVAGMTRPSGSNGAYALLVVRYNPNGSLDPTFGTGGKAITPVALGVGPVGVWDGSGMDLAIDDQGRIVVAGRTDDDDRSQFVARYTPAGQLDTTFGTGGLAVLTNDDGSIVCSTALALQANGRIVLASDMGVYYGVDSIRLTRLDAAGQVDPTFGTAGMTEVYTPGSQRGASAIAIDAAGRLVVGGGGDHFLVARFDADGNLDPTYGNGGIGTAENVLLDAAEPVSLALTAKGKAVLAGSAKTNSGDLFAAARFLGDDAPAALAAVAAASPGDHVATITAADTQPLLAGLTVHVADLSGRALGLAAPGGVPQVRRPVGGPRRFGSGELLRRVALRRQARDELGVLDRGEPLVDDGAQAAGIAR